MQSPERFRKEKAFVYNNQIINVDYNDLSFPIAYNDLYKLKIIENKNKIGVNIFEHKEGKKNDILPIYHSIKPYENCMNLLVISDNNKNISLCVY